MPYTLPTRQAGSAWSGSGHGAELGVVGGWLGPSDQEEIAAAVMLPALRRRCKRSHSWARRLAAVWQARSVANVAISTGPILGDHRVAPVPHICYVTSSLHDSRSLHSLTNPCNHTSEPLNQIY